MMSFRKTSAPIRPEIGIVSQQSWNPADFKVPRISAINVNVGTVVRNLVMSAVLAAMLYALSQVWSHY